jgi:hypothetical protein
MKHAKKQEKLAEAEIKTAIKIISRKLRCCTLLPNNFKSDMSKN